MSSLRAFFCNNRNLALLVVLIALCMKIVVPTGFMISPTAKVFTVQICDDQIGNHAVRQIAIPMKSGLIDAGAKQAGKSASGECPFAGHSMTALGGADPVLLVLALAFILALGFAPVTTPRAARIAFLRPPLRGPPALA